jgi:hypothetical protein
MLEVQTSLANVGRVRQDLLRWRPTWAPSFFAAVGLIERAIVAATYGALEMGHETAAKRSVNPPVVETKCEEIFCGCDGIFWSFDGVLDCPIEVTDQGLNILQHRDKIAQVDKSHWGAGAAAER